MRKIENLTLLSLGDSYTIGESVGENDRWTVQLAGLLRERKFAINSPDIIAQTGWTTAELLAGIVVSGNRKQYDLVTLLIGVNNQYRGLGLEEYRAEFAQLLQTAIGYVADSPGRTRRNAARPGRVVVLSVPDWGMSPFAADRDRATITRQIDDFNAVAWQECAKVGVAFIDITRLTRQATGDASQFAGDGLHYSAKQMKLWAEAALPVVEGLLK